MAQAADAIVDTQFGRGPPPLAADAPPLSPAADDMQLQSPVPDAGGIKFAVYEDLAEIEAEWRAFECQADGTVFQNFDWLMCWQRHVGTRNGVTPAVVVVRDAAGNTLFVLPLSVQAGRLARELGFLGSELCDYNAPLLSPCFDQRMDRAGFLALWETITDCLQSNPRLQFDLLNLSKMPEMVGAQKNPMLGLTVTVNPSGAYLTHLAGDWESFYAAKRSSSTRRRDRTKRKKLAEIGEVSFVNPENDAEMLRMLDTLMVQKARSFARMGVGNLFTRPGYAEFYRALAAEPANKHLVHMSSLHVGATVAAVNLGLTWHGCYYHLLASYDDGDVSRFGPGAAHLHDLLHQAIGRGFRIFDFTIGDERYKRDWCDTEIKLYDCIAGVSARGVFVAASMTATARLKRWIKQTPLLWSVFSWARAFAGALLGRFRR